MKKYFIYITRIFCKKLKIPHYLQKLYSDSLNRHFNLFTLPLQETTFLLLFKVFNMENVREKYLFILLFVYGMAIVAMMPRHLPWNPRFSGELSVHLPSI